MIYEWHDVVGNVGVFCLLLAYLLLQLEKISSRQLRYNALNLLGSFLILVSLTVDFNFSSVLIEIFWFLISLIGIVKYLRTRQRRSNHG